MGEIYSRLMKQVRQVQGDQKARR